MMKTKELLEARWKVILFALLALLVAGGDVAAYRFMPVSGGDLPPAIQRMLQEDLTNFSAFAWWQWFAGNGPATLLPLRVILGCGFISGALTQGPVLLLL